MSRMELYDLNIERALISAAMFDPALLDDLASRVMSSDFYLPFHQTLWHAMLELHRDGMPVDEEFARRRLVKDGAFDEVAMIDVMAAAPITNTAAYAKQLIELSQQRQLVSVATAIKKEIVEDGEPAEKAIDAALRRIERVAEHDSARIARKNMTQTEAHQPEFYCASWLPIPKSTLSMIVAPGGTGKTWISLQLAIRIASEDAGKRVFLWLSEDPEGTIKSRYDAIVEKILIGDHSAAAAQIDISTEDPVLLLEMKGRSVAVSSRFYTLRRELREYDVIIIDPLLAFFGGDENDNSQARVFMQPFLNWARSENKAIVFLHHSRKGDPGTASRARGAGAIVDAVRCVYDMDKIYINSSTTEKKPDPLSAHMRRITLTKDNYGAIVHLQSYTFERQITPENSARSYEIEYSDATTASLPEIT